MLTNSKTYGLFVGLISLDIEYLADDPPARNQKLVARDYAIAAGGPATNAAVAFSVCGHASRLAGVLGSHPIAQLIRADLGTCGIAIADLAPHHTDPPPTSSIIISERTGERAVISLNAAKHQASPASIPDHLLDAVNIVLIDGHQMEVGAVVAKQARDRSIPVVVDGGSWKPGFEQVLTQADYVIASATFRPPHCQTEADAIAYLTDLDISHVAITRGANPILYCSKSDRGQIDVPCVQAIDTLGAGDIFHGAFCHFILSAPFASALTRAARVASDFCTSFGTRNWLQTFDLNVADESRF